MVKMRWKLWIISVLILNLISGLVSIPASPPEYTVESQSLPEDLNWMPILSNGRVAAQVMSANVYKNGLYNGVLGLSHRARIPNYSNILVDSTRQQLNNTSYRMHYRYGVFETLTQVNNSVQVRHVVYAHRIHTGAIVNEITLTRIGETSGDLQVALRLDPGNEESEDIEFEPPTVFDVFKDGHEVTFRCGVTREKEAPEEDRDADRVCVTWINVPEKITLLNGEKEKVFTFAMTVHPNLRVALNEMEEVFLNPPWGLSLFHVVDWNRFWRNFNIIPRGNPELSRAIYASVYALVSALPPKNPSNRMRRELFYGLSPTGLGRGGSQLSDYEGHNLWDSETWMFPVVLLMDKDWSYQLLHYRYTKLEAAREFARQSNYSGARFPWESAYTGRDVTQPCCPEVAANQQHITADIGLAVENYYRATGNIFWMQREGCELVREIADYLASRTYFNRSIDKYEVKGVMGPDEDHVSVDNNLYTNVAFQRVLYFAGNISAECQFNNSKWSEIAEKMLIIYDSVFDYHPQYQGYEKGTIVKQADAILAGYPLLYPMDKDTRRNDLITYEQVTRSSGPAMTWSMFAINYLDVKGYLKADQHFLNGYQKYLQPPFLIWRETELGAGKSINETIAGGDGGKEETGAVNFLTGAGGFLQSILYGYAGLRVLSDRLLIQPPAHLMPGTDELNINGIQYRGLSIELIVRDVEDDSSNCLGVQGKQFHHGLEERPDYRFSVKVRHCSGFQKRITISVKDEEITVDCRNIWIPTKWYNWMSGGASIKVAA